MANTNKNNKPKRNASTKQGYYSVANPEKYIGDLSKVIFRSQWEAQFMKYCDFHPQIKRWASEPEPGVHYFDIIKQKNRTYFPDFYMEVDEGSGLKKFLVEVKPKKDYEAPPTVFINAYLKPNFSDFRVIAENMDSISDKSNSEPLKKLQDAIKASYGYSRMTPKRFKNRMYEITTFLNNKAKFKAAKEFANKNNMQFIIIDEDWILSKR